MQTAPVWPLRGLEANLPDQVAALAAAIRGEGSRLATSDTLPGRVALLFVVRTSRNLDAVAHLSRAGFAADSVGIVRAILEDTVALAYLADEPEARAEAWATFAEKRAATSVASAGPPDGGAWWSGMGPTKMAKKLRGRHRQIGDELLTVYWRLCDDTHGSPLSATHYVAPPLEEGRLPQLLAGPSSHRVAELSALGSICATRLCSVAEELGVLLDLEVIIECATAAMGPYNAGRST